MSMLKIASALSRLSSVIFLSSVFALVSACGGGGGSSKKPDPPRFSSQSSLQISSILSSSIQSSSSSSIISIVSLSGHISYDYVPHNLNHIGLNYSAIENRPVRGAVIELITDAGLVAATGTTDSNGDYSFTIQKNILVKVRVKAQLLNTVTPIWNFKVTDNTSNNALYVLDGSVISTGITDSQRNLHASSGWDGSSYSGVRTAAPFAILDNIYLGVNRITDAGNTANFNPLELRWSIKNKTAEGEVGLGEIGTSFYDADNNAIYILGDANNDTDEYDRHVLLHEWGHYIENNFSRADSIGGDHSDEEMLDMRVAMSEGFANSFSAMMLDDPFYSDAINDNQSSGFAFDVGKKNRFYKGYFSEGSVGSILYNYYVSSINKVANDFSFIFRVISNPTYFQNDALTSVYLFYAELTQRFADQTSLISSLMLEQNIFGADEYGAGETNNAGLNVTLPVYKTIVSDGAAVNVCSSPEFGKYNRLANSQFLKLEVAQTANYNFSANKRLGADVTGKPEFIVYSSGVPILYAQNTLDNEVNDTINLSAGIYIIEIYDLSNREVDNLDPNTLCFDVRVVRN